MTLGRDHIRLLDIDVTALSESHVAGALGDLIASGGRRTVVGHNLHSCYLYHTEPDFKALYDSADIVLLDGAPVYALWRKQVPVSGPDADFRVGSTDWIRHLDQVAGLRRLAVVGTTGESNAEACRKLQELLPEATILGLQGGYWNPTREHAVVLQLNEFQPQLVLFGLGMPLQESVLWQRRNDLPDAVYCAVGGALDQISGRQLLAPRWLGRLGLEWLWRLLLSPRRVFGRVFIEPWKLAAILIRRRIQSQDAKAVK